jgi:serine/threonine-protein kinase
MTRDTPSSDQGVLPQYDVDLVAGTQVGEYVVEAVVGRGGFGTVYRAIHPVISKRVAIKVLSRRYSADEDMVSRFIVEARAVNEIQHRNIIDIFSFGRLSDGRHYYVMEYVAGQTLDQYVEEHGVLSFESALPILKGIARALNAAHAKGIAHRDLKPENIMLVNDEDELFPKLVDFGIAKLSATESIAHHTGTGVPMGTPWYMSPEQCRGRDVDVRTDIYSFGVVVYRVLTGTLPFNGELIEVMHSQIHDEPEPPSARNPLLTPEIDAAIAWMMRKAPADRPRSILEGIAALAPGVSRLTPTPMAAVDVSALMPRLSTSTIEPRASSKRSRALVFGGLGAVCLAAITFFMLRGGADHPAPQAADTAPPAPPAQNVAPSVPPPEATVDKREPAQDPVKIAPVETPPEAKTRFLEVVGAPKGAVVFRGDNRLGPANAPIELPIQDTLIDLRVEAVGYVSAKIQVGPAQKRISVSLAKRAVSAPKKPGDRPDENDIMSFPK